MRMAKIVVPALLLALSVLPGHAGDRKLEAFTHVSSWVPNVGFLDDGELPLGDLWIFRCPNNATVSVFVDTKDDLDDDLSCLDPMLVVYSGRGVPLALSDDDAECSYSPICTTNGDLGASTPCPLVLEVPCGQGNNFHSIVVRDAGPRVELVTGPQESVACTKGGGYELYVLVEGNNKQILDPNLGGGASSALPDWLIDEEFPRNGPALDDENVPCHVLSAGDISLGKNGPDIIECDSLK